MTYPAAIGLAGCLAMLAGLALILSAPPLAWPLPVSLLAAGWGMTLAAAPFMPEIQQPTTNNQKEPNQ